MPYGVVNDFTQDTTPGAGDLLAPPAGFSGNEDEYFAVMRERFFGNPGTRTRLLDVAKAYARPTHRSPQIKIDGPYREAAEETLRRLVVWSSDSGRM
ncbi:hypothetical protein [Thioalkalivibrio sp. ALE16]|uniref:hypothetical protein n=1 Tax=Thioalkalivibrio sp. ALE16 TaxID=1158172 RepID=UPI00036BB7CC|nr:hypothetical protein [Thioalkalivibrio sp. ALE16]